MPLRLALRPAMLAGVALLAARLVAADSEFCIAGTVVNSVTGEPIRRAAVTTPQSATLSDAAGAFRFCGLPAGTYTADAEKPGFGVGGARVTVGPSREDVVLRLPPLAVIKGKVADGDGNPVEGAQIQLLSFAIGDGLRRVRVESTQVTDDRGEYRIAHLTPGRYLLRAAGWQGPEHAAKEADASETFTPTYYGGGPELASAPPLTVEPGGDVTADFSVNLGPSYRIRGTLAGFSARVPVKVELLGMDGEPAAAPAAFNPATAAFQVKYVAPGSYLLRATQGEGEQRLRGEQAVQIGAADANSVLLALAGAVTLKGVVRAPPAGSGSAPVAPNCSVALSTTATAMYEDALETSTGEDGAFEIDNVLPGRYRVKMDCANGYIASARAGGTDLLAHNELQISAGAAPPPIEAVLGTDGATVDVTATMDDEASPAWLVMTPASGNDMYDRFSLLRGKISLSGVAPGDYQIYAWSGSAFAFEYANPNVRQGWAGRAVSVQVAARDHQSITLKVPAGEPQ